MVNLFSREECRIARKMSALVRTAPYVVCPHGRMPHAKSNLNNALSGGCCAGFPNQNHPSLDRPRAAMPSWKLVASRRRESANSRRETQSIRGHDQDHRTAQLDSWTKQGGRTQRVGKELILRA